MVGSSGIRLGQGGRPALGALLVMLGATSAATAQNQPDIKRETEQPGRTTDSTVRATETQRDSLGPDPSFQGRDVTLEEVMRDPDNQQLNYAFALTQIRQGDLLGALSTLERMLLRSPGQPRVRLDLADQQRRQIPLPA